MAQTRKSTNKSNIHVSVKNFSTFTFNFFNFKIAGKKNFFVFSGTVDFDNLILDSLTIHII